MEHTRSFVGAGWAFPMGVDGRGGIAMATEEKDIARGIFLVLSTAKGERRMRPEFGCAIHDLVFAPNDATTHGLIRYHVMEALNWWEPRIDVVDVLVDTDEADPAQLLVTIRYTIKSTNAETSLVYPFYLIPGEG
jgi:phage baseplate assembly protein W